MRRILMVGLLAVQGWAGACSGQATWVALLDSYEEPAFQSVPCTPSVRHVPGPVKRTCYLTAEPISAIAARHPYHYSEDVQGGKDRVASQSFWRGSGYSLLIFPYQGGNLIVTEDWDTIRSRLREAFYTSTFEHSESPQAKAAAIAEFCGSPKTQFPDLRFRSCEAVRFEVFGDLPFLKFSLAAVPDASMQSNTDFVYSWDTCGGSFDPLDETVP